MSVRDKLITLSISYKSVLPLFDVIFILGTEIGDFMLSQCCNKSPLLESQDKSSQKYLSRLPSKL